MVDSRASIQETGADVDRESVVPTIFSSRSRGRRDRDQNYVHSLRQKFARKSLNGKLMRPSEERDGSAKLYEAVAEVKARNWEERNSDIASHEINQEFLF